MKLLVDNLCHKAGFKINGVRIFIQKCITCTGKSLNFTIYSLKNILVYSIILVKFIKYCPKTDQYGN